jgi:hypothetical protein
MEDIAGELAGDRVAAHRNRKDELRTARALGRRREMLAECSAPLAGDGAYAKDKFEHNSLSTIL